MEDLIKAYLSCRKNKRCSTNSLKFEIDFESNILALHKELSSMTYCPKRSVCFVVKSPKLREVFAADFRDRVTHHLLVSQLEPYYERRFISQSLACRKYKGTLKASKVLENYVRSITKNYTQRAYYGQFDIRSFFTSINKIILKNLIIKEVTNNFPKHNKSSLIWLICTILEHNPIENYYYRGDPYLLKQIPSHKTLFKAKPNCGLPIGNLTSQFFANIYLNELDQYAKRVLKIKYYVRYVDDIVILSNDLPQIMIWRQQMDNFLQNHLQLNFHSSKDKYNSTSSGIDFVGYIVKHRHTFARKRVVKNLKYRLRLINQGKLFESQNQNNSIALISSPPTKRELDKMLAIINSYYGHFRHANCYNLRKDLYYNNFGILKLYLKPTDKNFSYFSIIKGKNE